MRPKYLKHLTIFAFVFALIAGCSAFKPKATLFETISTYGELSIVEAQNTGDWMCLNYMENSPAPMGIYKTEYLKDGTVKKYTLWLFNHKRYFDVYEGYFDYRIVGDYTKLDQKVIGKFLGRFYIDMSNARSKPLNMSVAIDNHDIGSVSFGYCRE